MIRNLIRNEIQLIRAVLELVRRGRMNWEELAVAAPAAFLLGLIAGYIIRGRYHLEKATSE